MKFKRKSQTNKQAIDLRDVVSQLVDDHMFAEGDGIVENLQNQVNQLTNLLGALAEVALKTEKDALDFLSIDHGTWSGNWERVE